MFEPVKQRHDKVIIVAGGSSLTGFNLHKLENLKDIVTIAINDVYWHINANYFCSIDPINSATQKIRVHKSECYKYIGFKEPITHCHTLKRYECVDGGSEKDMLLCEDKNEIQTHNSAFSAFNLAYHFEAKKVLLLGVDADNGKHFYDDIDYPEDSHGYKTSISKIPLCFETASPQIKKRGIEVVNGSLQSRVNCFGKMSIDDGVAWLQQ